MYCMRCGAQSPEGKKFCTSCGAPLSKAAERTEEFAPVAPPAPEPEPAKARYETLRPERAPEPRAAEPEVRYVEPPRKRPKALPVLTALLAIALASTLGWFLVLAPAAPFGSLIGRGSTGQQEAGSSSQPEASSVEASSDAAKKEEKPSETEDTGKAEADAYADASAEAAGSSKDPDAEPAALPEPALLFPFDGGATASIGSASGILYDGASYIEGVKGQAISLDGDEDYLDLGKQTDLSGDWTLAMWLRPIAAVSERDRAYVLSKPGSFAFMLRKGVPCFESGNKRCEATAALPTGEWSFVAWAYSTADAEIALYVNGKPAGRAAFVNLTASDTSALLGIDKEYAYTISTANQYAGAADELAIYHEALTAEQVGELYEGYGER